jgi:hypothetical protein
MPGEIRIGGEVSEIQTLDAWLAKADKEIAETIELDVSILGPEAVAGIQAALPVRPAREARESKPSYLSASMFSNGLPEFRRSA